MIGASAGTNRLRRLVCVGPLFGLSGTTGPRPPRSNGKEDFACPIAHNAMVYTDRINRSAVPRREQGESVMVARILEFIQSQERSVIP